MPKINLSISLSEDMSQAVDRVRGDVQRSVWVRRAIQQRLEREHPNEAVDNIAIAPATPDDMATPRRRRRAA
jgi:metal-responsive CopG/Arc/MetJ family transcriptional regulator